MNTTGKRTVAIRGAAVVSILLLATCAWGQNTPVDFNSERWTMVNAQKIEYAGRDALIGFAYLEDVEFRNGVIEVDIYTEDGRRSYPGIVFRIQSQSDYESFYIRPHRSPLYPDALQYTPVTNGLAGWQLYQGDGFTAVGDIPTGEWLHIKLEVSGSRARVFLGDSSVPALEIHELQHGITSGGIGLLGPVDRTAYFSNFSYRTEEDIVFAPPPISDVPPGMIVDWEISGPHRLGDVDREKHLAEQDVANLEWQAVKSAPSGLVDIARYFGRSGREPDCAFARATIRSESKQTRKYLFGYSDEIHLFLNGKLLFHGMSGYRQRDPSFLGAIGLNDAVYLPLEAGDNELGMVITEAFGGWGFMCGDGESVYEHESLQEVWTTEDVLLVPETVVYDAPRKSFYVSNNDMFGKADASGGQFISKISLDGSVVELEWAQGVYNPAGMAMNGDRLLVAERRSLVEIDALTGDVIERHQVPEAIFLNDLTVSGTGGVYISDSGGNAIFRFVDGRFENWLSGEEIQRPNGVQAHGGKLVVGTNGDTKVKIVDLESKKISTLVDLGPGIIDGIEVDDRGDYLISQWEGRLYRVSTSGQVTKLLDTSVTDVNCANFAYVPGERLIVVPTFMDNSIKAYRIVD